MLAALLANLNRTTAKPADGGWLNRAQRRKHFADLKRHDELLRKQWQERHDYEQNLSLELRAAYDKLRGIQPIEKLVRAHPARIVPHYTQPQPANTQHFDFLEMARNAETAKAILTAYHDALEDEVILVAYYSSL